MAQAKRDQNRVPTLLGVDEATGLVPTAVEVSTEGELLVKLSSDIEIGAVEIKNAVSDVRALVVAATSDSDPDLDGTNLLGTHALLSARKDATTTIGLTAEDSTHNALHVAITDGEGVVNVNASNALEVSAVLTTGSATVGEVTIGAATGAAGDLAKIEDAQHATGDVGIMALAVENEDQADLSTGDKDYTPIAVTKEGNIIVKQEGAISVTESTPLTGFATSAGQLADGHAVTVDNGAAAAAVNIQDGGNSITVDLPNQTYSYDYIAAPGVDEVTKASAGFLHAILVGDAVASSIIEVSNHASDGDGAVVIYLAGDTLGPALYPVNMTMSTGICSDITNQTHCTFIYR